MTLPLSQNPPTRNTDTIFEEPLNVDSPWWVARTKSRQEKALAWCLNQSGTNYFLPLVARPQKNKTRLRISIMPLFPGYLFFRGNNQQRYEALKTGRIAQVIPVGDQATLNDELRAISIVCSAEEKLELCDLVREGQRARIVYGPLAGAEGIIREKKSKTRLILAVQIIGQAVRVEISMDQVTLIEQS